MFMFDFIKKTRLISLGLFLILITGLLVGCRQSQLPDSQLSNQQIFIHQDTPEPEVVVEQVPKSQFSGLPIAIVLDNLEESLPISGINRAAIIYEAPVEADITRFLSIFDQEFLPDKIGPVRSARPYLVDWAGEYGALFVHAGGSQETLQKISQNFYPIIYDLDEISKNGIYFWRDKQRQIPHNLYISKQSIIDVIKSKNLVNALKPDFENWPRTKASLVRDEKFKSVDQLSDEFSPDQDYQTGVIVKIDYRQPVVWQFDKDFGVYLRFQNNQPFVDEENKQVQTENLIIQKTKIDILDEIGRRSIETIGSGQALIFQRGLLIRGKWERMSANSRTKFYNSEGQEIEFLPGAIWIEIVSDSHRVLY